MMMTDTEKEQIYRDYHGKIYGYILLKINNRQDAEDIAAEVFVKIYSKLDTFDKDKAALSTWIYTIVRNTLTDYFRTRKIFSEIPEDARDDSSPEDEAYSAETLCKLAGALESLGERERDIIILRYYSGMTLKEIAEKLNVSYAYVKVLQKKALKEIKIFFEKQ